MKRIENVNLSRGIIIGSESYQLPETPNGFTHAWKVYVRPAFNCDLSFIKNITFTLHETFPNPVRTVAHPFEVEEKGWGEFTMYIKINFIDEQEKSLSTSHFVMLFPDGKDGILVNNRVVHEKYDEIIFRSPSKIMYNKIIEEEEDKSKIYEKEQEEYNKLEEAINFLLNSNYS